MKVLWFGPARRCRNIGPKDYIVMMPNDPTYCCDYFLRYYVNDPRVPITYDPVTRTFYYMLARSYGAGLIIVDRCLAHNKRLPKSLAYKYQTTIKKELGFNLYYEDKKDSIPKDKKVLPPEFLTDEWWRKRGFGPQNPELPIIELARSDEYIEEQQTIALLGKYRFLLNSMIRGERGYIPIYQHPQLYGRWYKKEDVEAFVAAWQR